MGLLLVLLCVPLFAQEQVQAPQPAQREGLLDTVSYLELTARDIQTADLYQLVDWARLLGIDHRGSAETLRRRLYAYYEYTPPTAAAAPEESQRITIRSADATRYFTLESRDEGYVEISGGVLLELYSPAEGSKHIIAAERLIYNQATGDISATGTVRYTLSEQDNREETFYGESLTVNLGSWESRFLKGYTLQNRTINEREITFSFYGDTIARSSGEIIHLSDGRITSSPLEEPSYRIEADEIWVYEPGEWLLDGATFYLGRVPVLAFPFFFQLRDKMLINPAFGFDLVGGAFMQTSTYFFGAPPKSEEASLSFLQLTEEEDAASVTEIRGLYRRTVENPTAQQIAAARRAKEQNEYGRFLLDYYNRRGLAAALDLSIGSRGGIERTGLFAGIGATRVVSQFPPYQYRFDDPDSTTSVSVWEGGWIGGIYLPFRFIFSGELTGSVNRFEYELSVPFNSDPRIDELFEDRRESIDWGELLAITETDIESSSSTLPDGFDWEFSSRWSADTGKLAPYLAGARVEELSSSLTWRYGTISGSDAEIEELLPHWDAIPSFEQDEYASRYFPYPVTLVLPKLNLRFTGSLPSGPRSDGSGTGNAPESAEVLPPWESEPAPSPEKPNGGALIPPETGESYPISLNADSAEGSTLSYSISPRLTQGISYDVYQWEEGENQLYTSPEEVDFDPAYTLTTVSADTRLNYTGSYFDNLWSLKDTVGLTFQEKSRVRTIDSSIPTWDSMLESDKKGSYQRLSHSLVLTNRPLLHSPSPVDQIFEYRLQHYLYQREYESAAGFRSDLFPWERESIQEQSVSSTTSYPVLGYPHTLTIKSIVPPLLGEISGTYTAELGAALFSFEGGIEEIDDGIWEPQEAVADLRYRGNQYSFLRQQLLFEENEAWRNFRLREGESELALATEDNAYGISGRFDYWINQEDDSGKRREILPERLSLTGRLNEFWTGYTMEYLYPVSLTPGVGWVQESEREFIPSELSFGYAREFRPDPAWKRRIDLSLGIDTGYTQDLNRYSDTSFFFKTSLNLGIHQFLDLQFSSYTENTAAFRYLPWLIDGTDIEGINPLEDLARSVNLFNTADRRSSNFNLRSIALKAVHHLDQWDLTVEYTGEPVRASEGSFSVYTWESNFSIYVQWNPIPELRQDISINDGDLSVE